jgi:hypothetical protein
LKSEATFIYAATEPNKPHSLAKVSADSSEISVDWLVPEEDGGSPIIAYQLYWDEGVSNGNYVLLDSIETAAYTVTGLDAGMLYSFKVSAVNVVGESLLTQSVAIYAAAVPT